MESSYIFVKINREKVQISRASINRRRIMSYDIVEVGRSLGRDWANLLVATGIPRDEKHRNSFNLPQMSVLFTS
jgi:hypothetical protein